MGEDKLGGLRSRSYLVFLVVITIILLAVVFLAFLFTVEPFALASSKIKAFDQEFENGKITIDANLFLAGESGHPALSDISEIPRTGIYDEINSKPRRFWVGGGCVDIKAPVRFEGVYAATNYSNPETAYIIVAPNEINTVVICVPFGTGIYVALWLK